MTQLGQDSSVIWRRHNGYAPGICDEAERLRALLKQAHDRDKFLGKWPTIEWYDDVARYFEGKVP